MRASPIELSQTYYCFIATPSAFSASLTSSLVYDYKIYQATNHKTAPGYVTCYTSWHIKRNCHVTEKTPGSYLVDREKLARKARSSNSNIAKKKPRSSFLRATSALATHKRTRSRGACYVCDAGTVLRGIRRRGVVLIAGAERRFRRQEVSSPQKY